MVVEDSGVHTIYPMLAAMRSLNSVEHRDAADGRSGCTGKEGRLLRQTRVETH
jgi:hypothetical protein